MGPLAGIGDTIGWAMIPTIFGSIAASMGMEGNPLGIFLWAAFTFVFLVVRILQYEWGYGMGVNVITKFGKQISVFTEACSVLGLTVVGSLVATVVKLSTGLQFKNGDVVMKVQELIDGVMPALLPVAAVGIISVSYTHLDVYKRQKLMQRATIFQDFAKRSNIWETAVKGIQAHPLLGKGPLTYFQMCIRDSMYATHIRQMQCPAIHFFVDLFLKVRMYFR